MRTPAAARERHEEARNGLDHPGLRDKVEALARPDAYPDAPGTVEIVETHMSFVFLAGDRVYKLKKPVRYPFLDFTRLAARRANCEAEVELNRRLAPDVYLGVVPLARAPGGRLAVGGEGEVLDWLVAMRRLPARLMLDRTISEGRLSAQDVARLAETLGGFYARAARPPLAADAYLSHLRAEQAVNRKVIEAVGAGGAVAGAGEVLDRLERRLAAAAPLLEARVRAGWIVDGHGDLRPEHVCLTDPVVVFDCLEFAPRLRHVDPFDEVAFLGMECALLPGPEKGADGGAPPGAMPGAAVGPALSEALGRRLGERPDARLEGLYAAFRAVLRARLSLAHLLDEKPREPERWGPQAARYLAFARAALG